MRLLLCRPQGGLNDILNQIEFCYNYSKRWNRVLIVDTAYGGSEYFKDVFSYYFTWTDGPVRLSNSFSDELLNSLSAFPSALHGRISSYSVRWSNEKYSFVDAVGGELITFDSSRDYTEELLIHQNGGGGLRSFDCLKRMRLTREITNQLDARLLAIPSPYPALHIRNSDMKTDYKVALHEISKLSLPHLFLATDDQQVLDDFSSSLKSTKIFSFSSLTKSSSGTLHTGVDRKEAREKNTDAILDLMMLALGSPLLLAKVNNNPHHQYSGYSRLALALNQNPGVIEKLRS